MRNQKLFLSIEALVNAFKTDALDAETLEASLFCLDCRRSDIMDLSSASEDNAFFVHFRTDPELGIAVQTALAKALRQAEHENRAIFVDVTDPGGAWVDLWILLEENDHHEFDLNSGVNFEQYNPALAAMAIKLSENNPELVPLH